MRKRGLVLAGAIIGLLVAVGLYALPRHASPPAPVPVAADQKMVGLFTSLPILWSEQADLRAMLDADDPPHWARAVLARYGTIRALDTLAGLGAASPKLAGLVLAQPRPLRADENVALDRWVRNGGRVLVFADPLLTQDSAFPLGDRRRPQDVVLLSPILARWGLELRFDDAQPSGMREIAGERIAVRLAGELAPRSGGVDSRCMIGEAGLVARCRIGGGRAVIVADAALLEPATSAHPQESALSALLDEAFAR